MSLDHICASAVGAVPCVAVPSTDHQPLHRLATVRRQQGVSRHAVAHRLKIEVDEVRQQETEDCDLPLSTLHAWRDVLDVPIAELLVEPADGPSSSILARSQLVRLMKSTRMLLEKAKQDSVRWIAQTMINQLVEIMPELADVGVWNIGGRQRRRSDLGVAASRRLTAEMFVDSNDDGCFQADAPSVCG
jgi:transcriptional regulator with XRE-family HTH domain